MMTPTAAPKNLLALAKRILFFSWLSTVKTFENANLDALKLDACLDVTLIGVMKKEYVC